MEVDQILDDVVESGNCISLCEEDVTAFRTCGELLFRYDITEDIAECNMEQRVKEAFEKIEKDTKTYDHVLVYMKGKIKFYFARKLAREVRNYFREDTDILYELKTDMNAQGVELVVLVA